MNDITFTTLLRHARFPEPVARHVYATCREQPHLLGELALNPHLPGDLYRDLACLTSDPTRAVIDGYTLALQGSRVRRNLLGNAGMYRSDLDDDIVLAVTSSDLPTSRIMHRSVGLILRPHLFRLAPHWFEEPAVHSPLHRAHVREEITVALHPLRTARGHLGHMFAVEQLGRWASHPSGGLRAGRGARMLLRNEHCPQRWRTRLEGLSRSWPEPVPSLLTRSELTDQVTSAPGMFPEHEAAHMALQLSDKLDALGGDAWLVAHVVASDEPVPIDVFTDAVSSTIQ